MREILYRAKRSNNEEWVEGCYIVDEMDTNKVYIGYIFGSDGRQPHDVDVILVDPETVCQYTGLTDKNGRKIFEGDIIKYHFGEDVAPVRFGSYQSCFDSQLTEHCGFYVDWKSERNFRKDLGYWLHMVDAEIVGNVYDNPDLIGE